ncbi:MAG: permease [Candidatus Hydrothermarchaeota archaeon]
MRKSEQWILYIVLAFYFALFTLDSSRFKEALSFTVDLFFEVLPLVIVAMLLAGLTQNFMPENIVSKLLGKKAGKKGLLYGVLLGTITPPKGLFRLPLLSTLLKQGATLGSVTALTASRSIVLSFPQAYAFFAFVKPNDPVFGLLLVCLISFATFLSALLSGFLADFFDEVLFKESQE